MIWTYAWIFSGVAAWLFVMIFWSEWHWYDFGMLFIAMVLGPLAWIAIGICAWEAKDL